MNQDGTRHHERLLSFTTMANFARGYSPLYAAIMQHMIAWIQDDQVIDEAHNAGLTGRLASLRSRVMAFLDRPEWTNDLDPVLRLAAVLHRMVIDGDERVEGLRNFYRTVGGKRSPSEPGFALTLVRAFARVGDELLERAGSWVIQSNETARGLIWLLPAAVLQIEAAYLLELGASAGLNLYAEHRSYTLEPADGSPVSLGRAATKQFVIPCTGAVPELVPAATAGPEILLRRGADASPVDLDNPETERILAACIWGDQPHRLQRLREGFALHRELLKTAGPAAKVERRVFPEDTQTFLAEALPAAPRAPVILFDTYFTAYLNDVDLRALERDVREFAHTWTLRHGLPWLWARFEPARAGESSPHTGWCRWFVDTWSRGRHRRIELGWAHPHLVRAEFGPGLAELESLRGPE